MWFWYFDWRKKTLAKRRKIQRTDDIRELTGGSSSYGLSVRHVSQEIVPSSNRGTAEKHSTRLLNLGRRRVFITVVLLTFLGASIGGAWFWYVKGPRNGIQLKLQTATKELEAKSIEDAIASKPVELRKSLSEYAEMSTDIRQILTQHLEEKHIGGAVAVAVTNLQKNGRGGIDPPEELGFKRIDHDKALVNRALKGEVNILAVIVTRAGEHLFHITIELKNNTGFPLECHIPKGQLVEIRNAKNTLARDVVNVSYNPTGLAQVGASAGDENGKGGVTVVPAWEPAKIEFEAYCANPYLSEPEGAANLTIFALEDISYSSWDELRELRIKKLKLAAKTSIRQT